MNIQKARQAILNKWSWEDSSLNIPIFVYGAIGIGKTYLVQQVVAERKIYELEKLKAKNEISEKQEDQLNRLKNYSNPKEIEDILNEHLVVIRCSQKSIEYFTGIPAPNFAEKSASFLMPDDLTNFKATDWCVVFLDELDKASPEKLTSCTFLVESNRLGSITLPKDTYIVAALNRITDSWLSKEIPAELKNRGSSIELEPDLDSWLKWAQKNSIRQDIINFLKYKKSLNENWLAVYDDTGDEEDVVRAFPTPRTWHFASRQADKLEKQGASYQEILEEMRQLIGNKAATEFNTYISLYSRINVEDFLNGSKKIQKVRPGDNKAISEQYITVFAICNYLQTQHLKDEQRMINLMDNINNLLDDLKICFIMTISSSKPAVNNMIHESKHGEALIDWFLSKVASI